MVKEQGKECQNERHVYWQGFHTLSLLTLRTCKAGEGRKAYRALQTKRGKKCTCTRGTLVCSSASTESSTQCTTQNERSRISMTSGKVGGALRSRMLFWVPRSRASSSPGSPTKTALSAQISKCKRSLPKMSSCSSALENFCPRPQIHDRFKTKLRS